MERFCVPHLPRGRVRRAFISELMPDSMVSELNDMGVITYKLGKSKNLSGELAYHPDILLNNYKTGCWICEFNADYIPKDFYKKEIIIESERELVDLYPSNCIFNNFRLNGTLFTGSQADPLIKAYSIYDSCRMITVATNYVKCSCVIVDNDSIITSDKNIAITARKHSFNVLYLDDDDDIKLNGFSHGLIGGCAVKLDKDLLAFTGDIQGYKFGDRIVDYCKERGVDVFSLSSQPLYDYGGILPITELVPLEEQDQQRMDL